MKKEIVEELIPGGVAETCELLFEKKRLKNPIRDLRRVCLLNSASGSIVSVYDQQRLTLFLHPSLPLLIKPQLEKFYILLQSLISHNAFHLTPTFRVGRDNLRWRSSS